MLVAVLMERVTPQGQAVRSDAIEEVSRASTI